MLMLLGLILKVIYKGIVAVAFVLFLYLFLSPQQPKDSFTIYER
jgi:hypothetical protein